VSSVGELRVCVIGSGISGLGAAWLLSKRYEVDLVEAQDRLGGHAHTSEVTVAGQTFPIDTGFMVFNHRTYPNLVGFFHELGIEEHDAHMSFSVQAAFDRIEWAGSLSGFLAQPSNLLKLRYWRMLSDILRFSRSAQRLLRETSDATTLGELLDKEGFGETFRKWYLVPMAAAIWSTKPGDIMSFPAATFLRFFDNHGLLHVTGKPAWKSVPGGSRRYVERAAEAISGEVRVGEPVLQVRRTEGGITVSTDERTDRYDVAVIATHPDQTLDMLEEAGPREREVLRAFSYQENPTVVHTDARFLPTSRRAHAAWNYFAETGRIDVDRLSVTYLLNKLQRLPDVPPVLVTLNPFVEPAEDGVLFELTYEHPVFDHAAIDAQRRITDIQGDGGIWYAGAWQRHGFHEDGLWSAVRVAAALGVETPWPQHPEGHAPEGLAHGDAHEEGGA
jgi:predicted NAD/FAD-binding protein